MDDIVNKLHCSCCDTYKDIVNFEKDKSNLSYNRSCDECRIKLKIKENEDYYKKTQEKILENKREYYQNNRDKIRAKTKEYASKDEIKEKIAKRNKKYREKNKEKLKINLKIWHANNKEHNLARTRKWYAHQMLTNPGFVMMKRMRRRLQSAFTNKGIKKHAKSTELIGCSGEELRKYIESKFTEGMSWERLMNSDIEIDHIKPCCAFDLTNEEEQRECFHYTNLQPLWKADHRAKIKEDRKLSLRLQVIGNEEVMF